MSTITWKGRERPDTPALRVIILFGGLSALADAIGKQVSTVQRWQESGFIPPRYQGDILRVAAERGIPLDPATFVPFAINLPASEPAA